ncbi:MAG: hypothetical protein ACOYBY_12095 [Dermatophilaceae bacterium]
MAASVVALRQPATGGTRHTDDGAQPWVTLARRSAGNGCCRDTAQLPQFDLGGVRRSVAACRIANALRAVFDHLGL